jgi:hypothetical protein
MAVGARRPHGAGAAIERHAGRFQTLWPISKLADFSSARTSAE